MHIDWKHIFNWDVVSIKAPEEVVRDGKPIGYRVVVGYKYHGQCVEFYGLDDLRLYKLWAGPKDMAQASYREHLRKMQRQTKSRIR